MAIPRIASYDIPQLPAAEPHWDFDIANAALLVHDMQQYFLDAYDPTAEPIATVLPNIRKLINAFDAAGAPVFYSVQPPKQAPERRGLLTDLWGPGMATDEDASIVPELAPTEDHHVITKWRYSAFERTDLRHTLAHAGKTQLVICGVYAHMGCQVSAADAFMNDIVPFIVNDAVADFSLQEHQGAVAWVGKRAGVATTTAAICGKE